MSLHGTCGEYHGSKMYLTSSGAGVLGTFLPNLSAALSWGIVAGSVSEPGRNQEESGEKLLRKLMRSQVFSEVFSLSSCYARDMTLRLRRPSSEFCNCNWYKGWQRPGGWAGGLAGDHQNAP